ncbi:hypothetical protein MSSAC_1963 [Methanosarcina siciliae C2J]|uniref:Uncharacterized protein n=1 Tax=Methanosarcina siciliae C2J TaxID=1434118 RepID=A0A0E3PPQ9_9EURY|nr:hypothetical protein MSSAC_1963 [Methanosarcina siciliae C2J]
MLFVIPTYSYLFVFSFVFSFFSEGKETNPYPMTTVFYSSLYFIIIFHWSSGKEFSCLKAVEFAPEGCLLTLKFFGN